MNYATQDYEVLQFKKGDYQDNYGNFWCDMAIKGVGEPVRIVVKDPTEFHDGMVLYGTIETKTSKAGKPYLRFKRLKKDDDAQPSDTDHQPSLGKWQPRDDDAIRAQWAIGQALVLYSHWNKERPEYEDIQSAAKRLFTMVEDVKTPHPKLVDENTTIDEIIEMTDEPIKLSDIPF